MTLRTITLERYWYLAVQDGALDDVKYKTESEAKAAFKALKKRDKFTAKGVCIMTREIQLCSSPVALS